MVGVLLFVLSPLVAVASLGGAAVPSFVGGVLVTLLDGDVFCSLLFCVGAVLFSMKSNFLS